jgi:hypothetical protein
MLIRLTPKHTIGSDPRPPRLNPRRRNLAAKAHKGARTRRAYRFDVQHFMRTLAITTPAELRQADHKARSNERPIFVA